MKRTKVLAKFLGLYFISTVIYADCQQHKSIVIAHRGASGHLPEHTLAAFKLAIEMGADYVEPDLVVTKDGEFIVRHEHYLSQTTDVVDKPEFRNRKRKLGDRSDWFSEDFTVAEIASLRTRQTFRGRSKAHDGRYPIPTFQQVIDLVRQESERLGRPIGLYPETKLPGHFQDLGFDVDDMLVSILDENGLNEPEAKVFIQSFEPGILKSLKGRVKVPLVQLVSAVEDQVDKGGNYQSNIPLAELSQYADGVGAIKWLIVNQQGKSSDFVSRAKSLDLFVHAWTFREDAYPQKLFSNGEEELTLFLKLGIDGFFTDFPDTGVSIRDALIDECG
jgi:glycerophosphoryl diester phosphodiesterase